MTTEANKSQYQIMLFEINKFNFEKKKYGNCVTRVQV